MSKTTICYVIGAVMTVSGLVLLLGVSDSLGMDILGLAFFLGGWIVGLMFTKAPTIAWRELANYFVSPIAYILMAAYLLVLSYFFNLGIGEGMEVEMGQTFVIMTWLALFICPIITMRLLAEEARSGTLETVLTAPITDFELTIGKFVGSMLFYLALQVPTLAFVYVLARQGSPDYGTITASYIGIVLFGATLISVGLLVSAFTKNQVISAFVSFVAMFMIFFFGIMGRSVGEFSVFGLDIKLGKIIEYVGAATHYMDFTRGLVSSQHALYYITLCVFFLFLTVRVVESHKWR